MVNSYHTSRILRFLSDRTDWTTVREISFLCDLTTAQAANYLTSLVHLGLVDRWERPWLNGERLTSLYRSSGPRPDSEFNIPSKSS